MTDMFVAGAQCINFNYAVNDQQRLEMLKHCIRHGGILLVHNSKDYSYYFDLIKKYGLNWSMVKNILTYRQYIDKKQRPGSLLYIDRVDQLIYYLFDARLMGYTARHNKQYAPEASPQLIPGVEIPDMESMLS